MKHVELFEFFVEGKDQRTSHVLLHITEPSTSEEAAKGYFFAIVELENGTIDQIETIQEMINEIESGYYETQSDTVGKNAFELTLEYINRKSADILDRKSMIHCIVGILNEDKLSFAYHGAPHALLFFKRKHGLERLDILEDHEEDGQLFPSVLEGELNKGDLFFVATPHVTDYFSYDRIQKILSSRTPRQSTIHIQKVLHDIKDESSFGGIILRVVPEDEIPRTGKKPKSKQGSAESLHKLLESERTTAEMLSPPIFGNLAKKIGGHTKEEDEPARTKKTSGLPETNYRPRRNRDSETIGNTVLIHLGRAVVYGMQRLFLFLKTLMIALGRFLVVAVIVMTNKNNGRRQVLDSLRRKWEDIQKSVDELPLISKLLFVATLILAIVFIGSITVIRVRERVAAEKQAYVHTVQAITDKKDAADAALIYGDSDKALTLLNEARLMLDSLEEQKGDEDVRENIRAGIEKTMQELRKIDVVDPSVLADLGSDVSEGMLTSLALIGNTVIAYGPQTGEHFLVNTNTQSVEKKTHDSELHLQKNSTPKEQDKIVFSYGKNGVAEFDPSNGAVISKDISYPSDDPLIAGVFVYNVRLYTLDAERNQIYKHTKTQTGYDKGTEWIKDSSADFSGAVSMAIDGDLFVLKESGEMLKFVKGSQVPFSITGLEPALERPTYLWTYSDVDAIYILEPAQKRVIILDKNGKLLKQFTAPAWENPTGMVVDNERGVLYILDQNKIYKLDI